MSSDTLSNSLSKILNADRTAKKECVVKPASKVVTSVVKLMNDNNYIGSFAVNNSM